MKTTPFTALIGLIFLSQITLSQKCIDYFNSYNRYETKFVDCPMVSSSLDKRQTTDNMFTIEFTCSITDTVLCDKARNAYITAGKYVTATLNLNVPLVVNATMLDICAAQPGICNGTTIIGTGGTARIIPFSDSTDNKTRYYPQAILKQMNLPQHPAYLPYDVISLINSNLNYWFEGDPLPLNNKYDMLYAVLAQFVHGLGFTTTWNDYDANIQALTPLPGASLTAPNQGQFIETIFDKYLVLIPDGTKVTTITDQLNVFKFTPNITINQFITTFEASPQFPFAQNMYKNATTRNAIGFLLSPNLLPGAPLTDNVVILETSLNNFNPAISISHVDLKTYENTADFLMTYTYPTGKTLDDKMASVGSTNTTGPIGPNIGKILGILG